MSLQVWLPLNGNLNNLGLDGTINITNTGNVAVNNSGKIGKCYEFSGSNYLSTPIDLSQFGTECSLAVWAKLPTHSSGNKQIINIGTASGWNNIRFGLLYRTNAAQIVAAISNGSSAINYSCNADIIENVWSHFVVTYKNHSLKIYINGILAKEYVTTFDPSWASISKVGIGAAPNGNEKLTGLLNDVRIYNHCLSTKEIEEIAKALILHYPLDNNGLGVLDSAVANSWGQNIVYDCSGYSNDGTITGSLTTVTDTPRYSCATSFDENTDSITITPYLSNGQTLNEITVSCWFKTNTLNGTTPNIFSLGENAFLRSRLASATSVWSYYRVVSTQKATTYSCKNLIDNNWHLLIFTFQDGVEKTYIDGEQIGSTDQSSTGTYLTCNTLDWHLARYRANSENFIGSLSDFRIYATALTEAQIKELYTAAAAVDKNGNIYARELVEV